MTKEINMLSTQCASKSKRMQKYLFCKYYKFAKRKVHKAIKKSIKRGESYVIYHELDYILTSKGISTEVLLKINTHLIDNLLQEGFYVRKYQFAQKVGPFEYTIAWGDEIQRHKNLDNIQERLMQERLMQEKDY